MKLSSQDLPDIDDVKEADIERVFGDGTFGKYAILEKSEHGFIQAGYKGRPADWAFECDLGTEDRRLAEEWKAFVERTGSEWWALEYIDEATGHLYGAEGDRTLGEVKQVFVEYRRGDGVWRMRYTWIRLNCCGSSAC